MRRFLSNCIDIKTRMGMVLSECSYNQACNFLEQKISEIGELIKTEVDGNVTKLIFSRHTFCYDESRGYLLQKS